jgi:hypothetical protein
MRRIAPCLSVVALLALACGPSEPDQLAVDEDQQKSAARAMETLSTAPELVRREVLKTCDKWKHIDHPCDEKKVRREQLDCWLEKGYPEMEHTIARKMRPWAQVNRIMLIHNLCMEMRRWRKLKRGPDF